MGRRRFYLKMITGSLLRRRSRMLAALLSVAIGAAILSGLVTIYIDIPRQMGQEFRSYGANLIFTPDEADAATVGGGGITTDTLNAAKAFLPDGSVVGVAPYRYEVIKINEQPFMAAGTELDQAKLSSPYWFVSGKWPETAREVLIGQEVADTLRLTLGGTFSVGTLTFDVAGILQTGGTEEAFVFMSLNDFEEMFGAGGFDVVECSISANGTALQAIADKISAAGLGILPTLVRRVTQSEGAVLTKLKALIYLVTTIVLLLTMICVATTMMAVVTERRKEIALRKALGASNDGIIREFLGEGVILGGFGGLLGTLLGFAFAQPVSLNVFGRSVMLQPALVPVTIIVSIVVTVLASLIPVRQTTAIDPAVVLKGE